MTENTKSPILKRIVSLIFLLLWMGLIFYLSSQNADDSSSVSGGLIKSVVKFFFPDISALKLSGIVEDLQFIVRKGAHFTLYWVLGILSFLTFVTYRMHLTLKSGLAFTVGVAYSVSDEYHQTFVSGRSGELRDILIDSLGVLCGITVALLFYLLVRAVKQRKVYPMKKKQYAELCEALKIQLNKQKKEREEIITENTSLKKELSSKESQLFELRKEIEELKIALKSACEPIIATPPEPLVPSSESDETDFRKEESASETEIKEVPQVTLRDDMEYGAEIIGKAVFLATEYCNRLSSEPGENNKELINLILGRTEVAKAEILKIISSNEDSQSKVSAMNDELNQAEDYFKSVMAQK